MSKIMKDFVQLFAEKTFYCLSLISKNNDKPFDKQLAMSYMKRHIKEKSILAIKNVQQDVVEAGFGLPFSEKTKFTRLQEEAQNISFMYECTQFANEILDNSSLN